jgi:hypothetical protein
VSSRSEFSKRVKQVLEASYFGSVVKNNQIYVVGGTLGFRPSQEHNSLRVYSPSKDVWADIEPPMSILKGKVTAVLASDE